MESYIVIRDYKPGDECQCFNVVQEGTMSTVNTAFVAGLMREITIQIMILASAVMFIFFGIPFGFCLASIPGVIVFMYCFIWCGHKYKAVEMSQDLYNIPREYMSSKDTGFWVAEAYNPVSLNNDKSNLKYSIVTEKQFKMKNVHVFSYFKTIVGTVAITKSRTSDNCGWLRRMAVTREYRRQGVATALLNEALKFCEDKDYIGVELVTTECHEIAREFYVKRGFELKQMYHKPIIGSYVAIVMFELSYTFKKHRISIEP